MYKRSANGKHVINPDGCTFFLSPTRPDEINKIIDGLDHRKSSGPNGIPVFILKAFKEFFPSGYQNWLISVLKQESSQIC